MATLKVHDKYLFLITCGQCAPDAVLAGVLTNLAALLHIALLPHQALAAAAGTRGKLSYYTAELMSHVAAAFIVLKLGFHQTP